jgi:hypothetical protein
MGELSKNGMMRITIIVAGSFYGMRVAFRICGFASQIRQIAAGVDQITSGNREILYRNWLVTDG